jgi:hypothetical protein
MVAISVIENDGNGIAGGKNHLQRLIEPSLAPALGRPNSAVRAPIRDGIPVIARPESRRNVIGHDQFLHRRFTVACQGPGFAFASPRIWNGTQGKPT